MNPEKIYYSYLVLSTRAKLNPNPADAGKVGLPKLMNDVNARLEQGWELYGPPFVNDETIFQALAHQQPGQR